MPFTKNSTATNSSRSLSGFWSDCPIDAIRNGSVDGFYHFDDFVMFEPKGSGFSVAAIGHGYKGYTSTGGAIADALVPGGALTFSSDGDDEGAALVGIQSCVQVSTAHKNMWFEARIKTSTITDTKHGIFCGLMETVTPSTSIPIISGTALGPLADKNFIGFHRLEADGDMLDCVHKADGVTQVTDLADAITLVADTYVNVGIKWDLAAGYLYFYKNGVVVKSVASSLVGASASPTSFPNDIPLTFCFGVANATGTTPGNSTIDWWACSQLL